MITLDALELPLDLIWDGEFEWTPIVQTEEYGLDGSLIIDSGKKLAGRPIVLRGDIDSALILRSNLKILYSMLSSNSEMTLTLDNNEIFQVRFDHNNNPISSKPVLEYSNPIDFDLQQLTVKFISV